MSDKKRGQELLAETGKNLGILDSLLIGIYGRRQDVARSVVEAKLGDTDFEQYPFGQPIFRPDIEDRRLNEVKELARRYGVNPNLAAAMEYLLIDESCKYQAHLLQSGNIHLEMPGIEEMRAALLDLTAKVADDYETDYSELFPATNAYLEYEAKFIKGNVGLLPRRFSALDLGCATGSSSRSLSVVFDKVVAVDLSPEMCAKAKKNNTSALLTNVDVLNEDFEEDGFWQAFEPESIDFVLMSFGTASDVVDFDKLIKNVARILRKDGRVVLSFYNSQALVYKAGFLPWRSSLAAILDSSLETLTVLDEYVLYAKAYSVDELRERRWHGLHQREIVTFPALLSVIPPEICINEATCQLFTDIDKTRSESGDEDGAYILTTLIK